MPPLLFTPPSVTLLYTLHTIKIINYLLAAHIPQRVPAVALVVELGLYDVNHRRFDQQRGGAAPAPHPVCDAAVFLSDICEGN